MRVKVDPELCTGCGLCVDTCPDIFEMDGDVARVIVADVEPEDMECAEDAADECPFEAITLAG